MYLLLNKRKYIDWVHAVPDLCTFSHQNHVLTESLREVHITTLNLQGIALQIHADILQYSFLNMLPCEL